MAQSSALYGVPNPHYIINVIFLEIAFAQKKKPVAPFDGVTGFYSFIMLLRSRAYVKNKTYNFREFSMNFSLIFSYI